MMRKLDYGRLITESESELQQLALKQNQARFRDYLRFLGHLKTGTATTQAAAGALVGLSARQSQNLWRSYRQHGLGHLLSERLGGPVVLRANQSDAGLYTPKQHTLDPTADWGVD
jgi:hypothetical protein